MFFFWRSDRRKRCDCESNRDDYDCDGGFGWIGIIIYKELCN